MKVPILDKTKKEVGKVDLPKQFSEPVRSDVVKRAVMVINANSRQPYGATPDAGMWASAELSRRRKDYRGSYGHGISRVPRKIMSRRGVQMNWVGAVAPGTVKGRRAHPPKAEKIWSRKINKSERRLAIRSALAAAMQKAYVVERGHKMPDTYPFVLDNSFEAISKTKDIREALLALGFKEELDRISIRTVRAGKGKVRGRRYKSKVGPLIVVSDKCDLLKAGRNLPGVNVVMVHKLNAKSLAPNATLGRLCLFTQKAVERLGKEGLFMADSKKSGEKQ